MEAKRIDMSSRESIQENMEDIGEHVRASVDNAMLAVVMTARSLPAELRPTFAMRVAHNTAIYAAASISVGRDSPSEVSRQIVDDLSDPKAMASYKLLLKMWECYPDRVAMDAVFGKGIIEILGEAEVVLDRLYPRVQ